MSSAAMVNDSEEVGAQPNKPPGRRRLTLVAAAVLVCIFIAAGVWFVGGRGYHRLGVSSAAAVLAVKPVIVDVPDIVTNLDNGLHREVFIRVKAKIVVSSTADQAVLNANMPEILDALQTYLRSMRPEEIHDGEGTYRLREALMNRVDIIVAPARIMNILFTQLLVQ